MSRVDEAIVLAGGRGTRLQPVVSDVPKPLAPVAGRPFLAWVLDLLAERGIARVVLATGHMAERVQTAIGANWRGMDIAYSVETEPLGTGGAIKLALARLNGDAVHVINGDTFLDYRPADLVAATRAAGADIGVALARVADVSRYGSAVVRGGRIAAFEEKGGSGAGSVNAGCYFLDRGALGRVARAPAAFSFETEMLVPEAAQGRVAAFEATSRFIDIGVPEDYARAQRLFGAAP